MTLSTRQRERLAVIRRAIQEIANRPDLSPAAKERGIRALKRAEARALQGSGTPAHPPTA